VGFRAVVFRAVVRFLVAAAFRPAAARFGDFRVVVFRAVVRFLVAADFFPAATRFGDLRDEVFRVVAFLAVVRFRVAADFFPAATRFVDRPVVDLGLGGVAPIDGADGIIEPSSLGIGRSLAGTSGCQDGSVRDGASSALSSAPPDPSRPSSSGRFSLPPHGQSRSCDGIHHLLVDGTGFPYPHSERTIHAQAGNGRPRHPPPSLDRSRSSRRARATRSGPGLSGSPLSRFA